MRPFQTIISLIIVLAASSFGTATALGQRDASQQDLPGLSENSLHTPVQDHAQPRLEPADDLAGNGPNLQIATTAAWGECEGCCEGLDRDGFIDDSDLLILITECGSPCP